ncbi:MAG: sigma-70 family RNA polymerase sigma factor [Candidatus Omnitrophota bacterium]
MLLSDEQLIVESGNGSLLAFELLVQRWDKRMLNYFLRCVGNRDEAEDLRQELFLRIYNHRRSFAPGGSFQAWLYRIATNLVIDKFARKRSPVMRPIDSNDEENCERSLAAADGLSRDEASRREIGRRIEEALDLLPGEMRIALVMRHFENLSFKDIAEVLHLPESTIKTRVYRGLDAMRRELKRLGVLEADCFQTA